MGDHEGAARSRRASEAAGGGRHFWLPVTAAGQPVGVRHAFRGNRWEGQVSLRTACGEAVALARPSEMDWVLFPTCADCNTALKSGHDGQVR